MDKAPRTSLGAPSRGRERPCGGAGVQSTSTLGFLNYVQYFLESFSMIIDQKTCLDINERTFLNELTTLHVLHAGLQKLYLDVKEVEAPIVNYELENRKKVTFFGFGNVERFGLPIEVEPLLTCYFHWFAVTVCNYVKLVGYLDGCAKGVI